MLYLTSRDVEEVLSWSDVVDDVRHAYQLLGNGDSSDVPRENIRVPGDTGELKAMAAATRDGLGGMLYSAFFNGEHGIPTKLIFLFESDHGELACLIEGDRLSWMRTGATGALATAHCARDDATTLGLIGAGRQARAQLLGINEVRALDRVYVTSRTSETRSQFVEAMQGSVTAEIIPTESAEETVEKSRIISTTTKSKTPVLEGEWLEPGTHVNAIGSHYPDQREVDTRTIERSRVIVDDIGRAQKEEGELLLPAREGQFDWTDAIELGAIATGDVPGRTTADEITLMTSGGVSTEYAGVASRIYERATEAGVGTELPLATDHDLSR